MAGIPITELKNIHKGADIWVIASGPSAGLIDPAFFEGKITLGVNRVWHRFKTDYVVLKESQIIEDAVNSGATVIASEFSCGNTESEYNHSAKDYFYFQHLNNEIKDVDLSVIGGDMIVVSYSTITSAMHVAAFLGAKNIILVGHDCGYLDGKKNFDGYPEPILGRIPGFYDRFLGAIEPQSVAVRERLVDVYGCCIYSLNPFLNFRLEGHSYESAGN